MRTRIWMKKYSPRSVKNGPFFPLLAHRQRAFFSASINAKPTSVVRAHARQHPATPGGGAFFHQPLFFWKNALLTDRCVAGKTDSRNAFFSSDTGRGGAKKRHRVAGRPGWLCDSGSRVGGARAVSEFNSLASIGKSIIIGEGSDKLWAQEYECKSNKKQLVS